MYSPRTFSPLNNWRSKWCYQTLTSGQRNTHPLLERAGREATEQSGGTSLLQVLDLEAQGLTSPPQSDTTRAKNLEAQIQARITAELEKLQSSESARFNKISEEVSAEPSPSSPSASDSPSVAEKLHDAFSQSARDEKRKQQTLSHDSVAKEIAELKKKLEGRKKVEKADPAVEKAKEEVVQCLRVNDRRPLDCWRQVENFKKEVGKMERSFVERTVR